MIGRVWAIGWTGFLRLLRSRVYLNLLVAGIALVTVSLAFEELSGGEGGRVLVDLGLAFIAVVVALLAGILSITTITKEIETKEIHIVAARAVERGEIVLGRFLTIAVLVIISNVCLGALLAALAMALGSSVWHLAFLACVFASFEAFVVAAIALFFGTGSSSTMSALFTLTLFVVGRLSDELMRLIAKGAFGDALAPALSAANRALPQLSRFDLTRMLHTDQIHWAVVAESAAYGSLYAAGFLLLAAWRFARRDLL